MAVAEFMETKQHLSELGTDFVWTTSVDYEAENQKMTKVKEAAVKCKYFLVSNVSL